MKTFAEFWTQLLLSIKSFIGDNWNELTTEAIDDAEKFLTGIKDDAQRWISLLAEGKLTSDDLLWLVKGKRDQAELLLLKEKGLAKPDLDKFFEGLIETILSTALKIII
ncbi:MAG: hypothetical protein P4L69_11245 [Desulfosporosinus sp.]|nr:hypothetical protein [Desulfosporosinus sp.]